MQNNIAEDGAPIELNSDIGGIFRVTSDGRTMTLLPETLGYYEYPRMEPKQS